MHLPTRTGYEDISILAIQTVAVHSFTTAFLSFLNLLCVDGVSCVCIGPGSNKTPA